MSAAKVKPFGSPVAVIFTVGDAEATVISTAVIASFLRGYLPSPPPASDDISVPVSGSEMTGSRARILSVNSLVVVPSCQVVPLFLENLFFAVTLNL